jgi:hypothetical protein
LVKLWVMMLVLALTSLATKTFDASLYQYRTPQVDKHVQEIDLRHINPAADFIHIVKLMQKGPADIVHPYDFQAILAAKGGKNGEEFASGEGA